MGNYAKVDCFLVVMDQFKQDCLRCHNELRKKHGVAPLVLDQQMCTVAQKKADQLASEEKMYHSGSGYDECSQLSSQLVIPNIGLSLPARGIASPILFNSFPLQWEYGMHPKEPSSMKYDVMEGDLKIDSIRHVYLGGKPQNTRYCTRCKSISLVIKGLRVPRSAAAKSWDMRWQMTCPCRGNWSRQES